MKGEFVYASAEITAESARRDRLEDSLLAEKAAFNLAQYTAFTRSPVPPVDLVTGAFTFFGKRGRLTSGSICLKHPPNRIHLSVTVRLTERNTALRAWCSTKRTGVTSL
jgi:hypothetical protein